MSTNKFPNLNLTDLVNKAGGVNVIINGVATSFGSDGHVIKSPSANDNGGSIVTELPARADIGKLIQGKGIYIGEWAPEYSNNTFDLYAAPEDIKQSNGDPLLMTFNHAVEHVAGLQNWHGHNGVNFKNSDAVMEAARNNLSALENWFIPIKEILHGRNTNGYEVQSDNLYAHRKKMPNGSELITTDNGSGIARWYWSCTEHPDNSSLVFNVDFMDGDDDWNIKDFCKLSMRPVRAEPRL